MWYLDYSESVAVFSNRFTVFNLSAPASIIGGANIHIFVFTNLNNVFQKKLMTQNTIYEYSPLQLSKLHSYATGNHVVISAHSCRKSGNKMAHSVNLRLLWLLTIRNVFTPLAFLHQGLQLSGISILELIDTRVAQTKWCK